MHRTFTPDSIHPPLARYSHAVEVEAGSRMLFLAGQVGIRKDGSVPEGIEEQTRLCFEAIDACLKDAGMDRGDVVRLNVYLVEPEDRAPYMAVRDAWIGDPPPASTMIYIKGLARPELRIEVEAVAARKG